MADLIAHHALFADTALARRLEQAEGRSNADFVAAKAAVNPQSGACWIKVAGAYALYDGADSPLTQTFCLGMFDPVTPSEIKSIEDFFRERGAHAIHEISPLADPTTLTLLNERGYRPVEFTTVMYRSLREAAEFNVEDSAERHGAEVSVSQIGEAEHELWAQTAAHGWSEFAEYADMMLDISRISLLRKSTLSFIAKQHGRPIATGAMSINNGVALLAGASTIPEARRQGAQRALLESRLRHAANIGCDVAMMCALPGSASQRNAERQNFRIAYTRMKWRLEFTAD